MALLEFEDVVEISAQSKNTNAFMTAMKEASYREDFNTSLCRAIEKGNTALVIHLLGYYCSKDEAQFVKDLETSGLPHNPLFEAVKKGNEEVVSALIKSAQSLDHGDRILKKMLTAVEKASGRYAHDGHTNAFHAAIQGRQTAIVRQFIAASPDHNTLKQMLLAEAPDEGQSELPFRDPDEVGPARGFRLAACQGDVETAEALLIAAKEMDDFDASKHTLRTMLSPTIKKTTHTAVRGAAAHGRRELLESFLETSMKVHTDQEFARQLTHGLANYTVGDKNDIQLKNLFLPEKGQTLSSFQEELMGKVISLIKNNVLTARDFYQLNALKEVKACFVIYIKGCDAQEKKQYFTELKDPKSSLSRFVDFKRHFDPRSTATRKEMHKEIALSNHFDDGDSGDSDSGDSDVENTL